MSISTELKNPQSCVTNRISSHYTNEDKVNSSVKFEKQRTKSDGMEVFIAMTFFTCLTHSGQVNVCHYIYIKEPLKENMKVAQMKEKWHTRSTTLGKTFRDVCIAAR